MFLGKFDHRIVSDDTFKLILTEVENSGHTLLTSKEKLGLGTLKEIVEVTPTYTIRDRVFRFYLRIPTSASDDLIRFKLFKSFSWPLPLKDTNNLLVATITGLPPYIAVSENHYLSFRTLEHCQKVRNEYYCPLTGALHLLGQLTTCGEAVYLRSQKYRELCEIVVTKGAQPQIMRMLNTWVYYLNQTESLEIICDS